MRKYRLVQYTDDGCSLYQCLSCKETIGEARHIALNFCSACGIKFEGRHECPEYWDAKLLRYAKKLGWEDSDIKRDEFYDYWMSLIQRDGQLPRGDVQPLKAFRVEWKTPTDMHGDPDKTWHLYTSFPVVPNCSEKLLQLQRQEVRFKVLMARRRLWEEIEQEKARVEWYPDIKVRVVIGEYEFMEPSDCPMWFTKPNEKNNER